MRHISLLALTFLASTCCSKEAASADPPEIQWTDYMFEARGTSVAAERGEFWVPEDRSNPAGRKIKLSFVRFPSSNSAKGAPIVYLAGGPGGSGVGTARGPRFPIFMALRDVADVIAFDQRGTGWSNDLPLCQTSHTIDLGRPLTREAVVPVLRRAADECGKFWTDTGIAISAYNTDESVADIEDLRRALGVERVKLWGISYGSHLALAILKRYPARIERAVLAGIEGLDETVKLPARTDAFVARVQAVIDSDPQASKAYPDLAGTMRRVHAALDATPVAISVKDAKGADVRLIVAKFAVQLAIAGTISDPAFIARVPVLYASMDAGNFGPIGTILAQYFIRPGGIRFSGMAEAMDIASGISTRRNELVRQQAQGSLLGDALNFPMPHLIGTMGVRDLGESFRAPVTSDVPTLFISGTLDGRTYPESSAEIAAGFENATRVLVQNGGHNIFEAAPQIGEMVVAYMKGEPVTKDTLVLPPPQFVF